jgi:hypothetical protein
MPAVSIPIIRDAASPDQVNDILMRLQGESHPQQVLASLQQQHPDIYGLVYEQMLRAGASHNSDMYHEYCFRNDDGSIRLQPHLHQEWNHVWDLNPMRFFIMAPRDHSKTTQTIQRVLLELGKNTNLRIKIVSNSDDRAGDILGALAEQIQKNPYYRALFPNVHPSDSGGWTKHKLFVERSGIGIKDASIEALGVLSTATGGRADLLIFDDIVDFRNAVQNPALRDIVRQAFYDVWLNLLEPDGRAWVLGTQWHEDDLYRDLTALCEQKDSGWIMWKKPCVVKRRYVVGGLDAEGKPTASPELEVPKIEYRPAALWPERWTLRLLEAKRAEVGERAFARQWLLKTISESETQFTTPVWREDKKLSDIPRDWPRYMGIDLASSFAKRGAFTVFFTIAVDPQGKRYPIDIVRGKMTFDQIARTIIGLYAIHKHDHIKVETNAFQTAIYQHIEETYPHIPISSIVTGRNKADEHVGIPSLTLEFERHLWEVWRPEPGIGEESVWTVWNDEIAAYPIGTNTDTVMATWFAREARREFESVGRPRLRVLHDDYTLEKHEVRMAREMAKVEGAEVQVADSTVDVSATIDEINDGMRTTESSSRQREVEQYARLLLTSTGFVDIPTVASFSNETHETVTEVVAAMGLVETEDGRYEQRAA